MERHWLLDDSKGAGRCLPSLPWNPKLNVDQKLVVSVHCEHVCHGHFPLP